jgi:putative acetyltransferase
MLRISDRAMTHCPAVTDTIRSERPADNDAITEVVGAAFKSPAEARLVELIRASEHYVPEWALVAERDGHIAGHVMVSYTPLAARRIPMLSPLAVAPELHNQGIGGALVREVCARVDAAGEPCVILEGSPVYYSRFGFEPSAPLGVILPLPDWVPPEAGQLLRLRNYDASITGTVVYPPAFDDVT